ncbi:MAG: 2TM domain-containing protein [Synechococcales bacterium]|nr:2TM domain-containing protein [Synechococcales bacterium]
MPPRWPRQPDRKDPAFRRLDDRMTFATHVAIFAATNSGLWFFRLFNFPSWIWVTWVTTVWLALLVGHGVYIFAIANYSEPPVAPTKPKGFAKNKSSS